jgi:predicted Zn finger-like uncharacterized protein
MNIACSNCPAKYAVPDDKVRGRKVRITCKRCGAGIVVDGTKLVQATAEPSAASARARHSTKVGGLEAPGDSSRMPQAAAAPAAPAEGELWTVAVTDDDQREMTLAQIVDAYAAGTIDAETFIWREGMDDWLTPYEIPVIETILRQRGLAPRTSTPPEPPAPEPPRPKDQSGAWREPGRWDADQPAANVSFDDVTVAMAAPKAQALLEAVTATGAPSLLTADDPDESTVVADSRRFGVDANDESAKQRPAPRPAAGSPAEAQGVPKPKGVTFTRPDAEPDGTTRPAAVAARATARRQEGEVDLFAQKAFPEEEAPRARMPSTPDAPRGRMPSAPGVTRGRMPSAPDAPRARMPSTPPEAAGQAGVTGARNETSVLFTLDQLTRPAAKPAPRAERIDAEALLAPSAAPVRLEEDGPPSVAKIGGGGLFPTAAMAAPDFTAPAVPSAPSHPPPSAGTRAAPAQERSGGSSTLWIVLGVLGVVGAGTASYLFMVRPPVTPNPEPTATATVESTPATTAPAATANVDTTAMAAETASAPATAPSAAAAPSAAPIATQAPTVATAMPAAPGTAPVATPGATAQPKPTATATAQPKPTATATATATEAPVAAADGPPFDKESAAKALGAAATQAQGECASQEGTHGSGKVTVTFVNSGRATNALVSGDFAGSALGGCVARVFRGAKVPPFSGDSVRVTKGVQIP